MSFEVPRAQTLAWLLPTGALFLPELMLPQVASPAFPAWDYLLLASSGAVLPCRADGPLGGGWQGCSHGAGCGSSTASVTLHLASGSNCPTCLSHGACGAPEVTGKSDLGGVHYSGLFGLICKLKVTLPFTGLMGRDGGLGVCATTWPGLPSLILVTRHYTVGEEVAHQGMGGWGSGEVPSDGVLCQL